jgi:hypothetical protein
MAEGPGRSVKREERGGGIEEETAPFWSGNRPALAKVLLLAEKSKIKRVLEEVLRNANARLDDPSDCKDL